MNEMILLKLGEVVLKGLNRRTFEDKLLANIRRRLQHCGDFHVYSKQSTVYVEPKGPECDLDGAFAACRQVFGVIAVTRALPCPKDKDAIFHCARNYLDKELREAKTFKVETRRSDKHFPMNSMEISQYVGGLLHDAYPHLKVDVHAPELCVHVEVREKAAYVHAPSQPGAGGLPTGMGGTAVSLLSGGIDSPVACHMIAKRGVKLELVHFYSPPYTSVQAKEKVVALAKLLAPWCGRMKLHVVPFTEIQEAIRANCPEDHFTLIMRRFMMRLAQGVAARTGAKALVTGESLGQVASQTMDALTVSDQVCTMPVLRPVIGMDKAEIVRLARQIGTFETSILPYEDCCTVFTPRHPRTHPVLADVLEYEKALDIDGLVERALAGVERITISV
ncbi:MAG: tRNA 4-thiouridine(8) synthase ThiI [Oscillospiraceae bacterium]|jgi:thiamine biosynthesis protein ThiI|nr:tRNA 4-thiouridine(8) synthase ThiI [Oscillospiraceae bacterium]